uniref:Uncharacterized protein n=1 Tax=Arundo donax TaxID=35708 RepID=A0A0A9A4T8_ARUDO
MTKVTIKNPTTIYALTEGHKAHVSHQPGGILINLPNC